MKRVLSAVLGILAALSAPACSSSLPADSVAKQSPLPTRKNVAHACFAVPADLQTACPIERGHILAVKAVREPMTQKGRDFLVGATIYVPASPGTTAEWLGRRIRCYQARMTVEPPPSSSVAPCPFAYSEANVRVDGTSDGFAVTVKSEDLEMAHRILEMSESLASTL